MKELIEKTVEVFYKYDGKLNYYDYDLIVDYMVDKNWILIEENNRYKNSIIEYVMTMAKYYLDRGYIE